MGCDIHPVLERRWKNEKTGETKWVGVHAYPYARIQSVWHKGKKLDVNHYHMPGPQRRNYDLFAKLAGVRGEGPEPRGLPYDVSDLARMEIGDEDGDLHSHSWATAREYVAAALAVDAEHDEGLRKAMLTQNSEEPRIKNPYLHYMEIAIYEDEGNSPDDYRIVFAFDN